MTLVQIPETFAWLTHSTPGAMKQCSRDAAYTFYNQQYWRSKSSKHWAQNIPGEDPKTMCNRQSQRMLCLWLTQLQGELETAAEPMAMSFLLMRTSTKSCTFVQQGTKQHQQDFGGTRVNYTCQVSRHDNRNQHLWMATAQGWQRVAVPRPSAQTAPLSWHRL